MGAGRQTQKFLTPAGAGPSGGGALGPPPQRNLGKAELGGVIFGCTHVTMNECLNKNLFGLPMQHIKYVQHIRPGLCLFLFNYSGRLLHGIYEAAGDGAANIDPSAWTEGRDKTQFPAQVKFKIRQSCYPLPEGIFRDAIADNYFAEGKFTFELTISQKDHLVSLFMKNVQGPVKSIPAKAAGPVKPKTFNSAVGNAWQKVETAKKTDVKSSISNHGKAKQEASENIFNVLNQVADNTVEDSPQVDIPNNDRQELDKADQFSQVVEKVQKVAPQQETQSSMVLERFQGLDISSGIDSQQRDTSMRGGLPYKEVDPLSGMVVALTPKRMSGADWELQAKERVAMEQILLREDREKLWVTSGAVDMKTATVFKRILEASANTIAQMRQDSIESHRLMLELRARTDQQLEQQRALEKLQTTNAMLEQSKMDMAAELAKVRSEMNELKLQVNTLFMQGQDHSNKLLYLSSLGFYADHYPVAPTRRAPQELFIIGGLSEEWLDTVVAYSPLSNQLRNVASLLGCRAYAATSFCQGSIYLYGGGDGASWSDVVERYDTATDRWELCPPMAIKRGSLGGATVRGKIYALGGGNGASSFNDTECYDPIVGIWTPSTKMLEKRFCVASTELNGAIYALGGFDGVNYLTSGERFDPREGIWREIAPMSVRRGSLTAACLNENLYALGGFDGGLGFLNSVEVYDPRANRWMLGAPMITARAYGASVSFGDAIYTLGGMEFFKQSFHTSKMKMEVFSEASGWQSVPMGNMSNRNFVAAAAI